MYTSLGSGSNSQWSLHVYAFTRAAFSGGILLPKVRSVDDRLLTPNYAASLIKTSLFSVLCLRPSAPRKMSHSSVSILMLFVILCFVMGPWYPWSATLVHISGQEVTVVHAV